MFSSKATEYGLLNASQRGDIQKVLFCLDYGINIDTQGAHGQTALHKSCGQNQLEVTILLLDRNANIESRERFNGYTPLHEAAHKGSRNSP